MLFSYSFYGINQKNNFLCNRNWNTCITYKTIKNSAMNGDILVPITFIATLFGIIYLYLKSRHRERLHMIEKGVSSNSLYSKARTLSATLKIGMLCIGIGIGILMGYLINCFLAIPQGHVLYFVFSFLFGGLALILNYRIEKNRTDGY